MVDLQTVSVEERIAFNSIILYASVDIMITRVAEGSLVSKTSKQTSWRVANINLWEILVIDDLSDCMVAQGILSIEVNAEIRRQMALNLVHVGFSSPWQEFRKSQRIWIIMGALIYIVRVGKTLRGCAFLAHLPQPSNYSGYLHISSNRLLETFFDELLAPNDF